MQSAFFPTADSRACVHNSRILSWYTTLQAVHINARNFSLHTFKRLTHIYGFYSKSEHVIVKD